VLISSWIAVSLRDLFHVPKIDFPSFSGHALEFTSILSSFFASVLIGITAALLVRLFFFARGNLGVLLLKSSTSPIIRGAIGGSVLSILYFMGPFDAYRGLGIDGLEASFREVPALGAPILKLLFTALALAAGFKGGEFIPLFFVGASAGSVIHGLGVTPFTGSSGMNVGDFAAIGCVSVFSGASRMPITCLVLGIELFGAEISPMLLISLMLVHWLSGKKSIYST
ncbi:hypothetical protein EBZ37_11665, partial [bacterium]|nr:hypothetical protein [bacterium]